ncbi:hypothetical protein JOD54_001180 [Actinokineospora baliensis]|nr:hypothetical protein [Actinokineospora baliensis]MBM7770976.1 hypothetical protein [Actinokineospora baliensis]
MTTTRSESSGHGLGIETYGIPGQIFSVPVRLDIADGAHSINEMTS